jgi:hypothetical protein
VIAPLPVKSTRKVARWTRSTPSEFYAEANEANRRRIRAARAEAQPRAITSASSSRSTAPYCSRSHPESRCR